MTTHNSNTWDDAIERAQQWEKERKEAIEADKKRAIAQFEDLLKKHVAPAVLEKLHFEVVAHFPEGADPEIFPVDTYATFRTSRAEYVLDVQSGVWDAYPRGADREKDRPIFVEFDEDVQNQLVLLYLEGQRRTP